jgi:hypothetical protein
MTANLSSQGCQIWVDYWLVVLQGLMQFAVHCCAVWTVGQLPITNFVLEAAAGGGAVAAAFG